MIIIKNTEPDKLYVGSQAQAQLLVHQVVDKLHSDYPLHIWHAKMSGDHSVITIQCLNSVLEYGYVLHTEKVQNDPDLKCVRKAGGEILERAFKKRGKNNGSFGGLLDLQGVDRKRLVDKDRTIKVVK